VAELIAQLQGKKTSLERLRRMLFGSSTEKTEQVLGEERAGAGREGAAVSASADGAAARQKAPGHGRNAASFCAGAEHIRVAHADLSRADAGPGCPHGKVYPLGPAAVLARITGMAPLRARVWDRLRCNLCGEVYSAPPGGCGAREARRERYRHGGDVALRHRAGLALAHTRIRLFSNEL
jgi:transposase